MFSTTTSSESEIEYYRPFQVEAIFGISQPTIRNYVRWGYIKGISNGKTMVLINAADLREKLKRVESGEPWEHVFYSPVVKRSLSPATSTAVADNGR